MGSSKVVLVLDKEIDSKVLDLLPPPCMIHQVSFPRKKAYPTCSLCGLIFLKELDLKLHLEADQWGLYKEKTFGSSATCEECCLFFDSQKGFMQHQGKVHQTKYKYSKCSECNKKFKNKYAVRFHQKQVHDKTTREKCPSCGKEFYNKYLIPDHLLKCSYKSIKTRNAAV